jgi:hypothetical protein
VTTPQSPRKPAPVAYKGEPLDAERGPGLGCFWIQMFALVVLIILTPLSVDVLHWGTTVTVILLFAVILLLLITGQSMIFLLRLVAAGRSEGRRRPLASASPTVGEIEDEAPADPAEAPTEQTAAAPASGDGQATGGDDPSGVRQ